VNVKSRCHTLPMPFTPDDVVQTNLILQLHLDSTKILPFRRDQLPTDKNNKITNHYRQKFKKICILSKPFTRNLLNL